MTEENTVLISTSKLTETAKTFRDQKNAIQTQIDLIAGYFKTINDDTDSAALQGLYDKIVDFQGNQLPSYCDVIDKYAGYLDRVAEEYEKVESDLTSSQGEMVNNSRAFK